METVKIVDTVETVRTVDTVETVRTVETVATVETLETKKYFLLLTANTDTRDASASKNGEMCSSVFCQLSHQLSRASFVRFAAALFAISASTAAIAVEIDADTGLAEVVFEQSTSR